MVLSADINSFLYYLKGEGCDVRVRVPFYSSYRLLSYELRAGSGERGDADISAAK